MLIAPYLSLAILAITPTDTMKNVITICFGFLIAIYLSNMIYAFILIKLKFESKAILFWAMILKLCNIPLFAIIFLQGLAALLVPVGFLVTIFSIYYSFLLILPTSMYGISGLIQANREGKINNSIAVITILFQFILCLDVISTVVMYIIVKGKDLLAKSKA